MRTSGVSVRDNHHWRAGDPGVREGVPGFGGQQWVSSKVGAAARERKKEQQRLHKGLQAVEGRAEARRCAQPEPEAVKSAFDVLRRGAAARRRADERQDGRCGLRAILPMCANRAAL
jgi:hypothetical protein